MNISNILCLALQASEMPPYITLVRGKEIQAQRNRRDVSYEGYSGFNSESKPCTKR